MKRLFAAALISAAVLFSLSSSAAAQTTRTYSLTRGDTITPAVPSVDPSGTTTYYGVMVAGQVEATNLTTFTLSVTFRNTGVVDSAAGIYSGTIVSPFSSFVVTQSSGRKSVSTSGRIDAGSVTYRVTPDGFAEIISVVSGNLSVWEGKNKNRRVVGYGMLDYGTSVEGSGTMVLTF